MVSRLFLAACGCAAVFALSCQAQSSSQPSESKPTVTQEAAQQSDEPASQQAAPANPAPLQLHDLPPDAHTATPEELAQQRQQRALAAAERLASVQAHWGPDMSSPGLAVNLTEVSRDKLPDGSTQVTYHVTGSGFSSTDRLALVRWPLDSQSTVVMDGIAVDSNGMAVCGTPLPAQPNAPSTPPNPAGLSGPSCTTEMHAGDPIVVKATAAAGEPVRVALIGNDRKHGAAVTAVPFPIADEDKGCKLSVMLGVKDGAMALVEGTGFPPNTPLTLESVTEGKIHTLNPKTNAQGRLVVIVLPAMSGEEQGDTTVRFAGVSHVPSLQTSATPAQPDPDCKPSVTFHWGKGSYKPR